MININKSSYIELIEKDLDFLNKHCSKSLELNHIKAVLAKSIDLLYPITYKPKLTIESAINGPDKELAEAAQYFKDHYNELLEETIQLSKQGFY